MRKAKVNHSLYESWTNENAWLLGLITSDGCMSYKHGRTNEICIINTDIKLLEAAKKVYGTNRKISLTDKSKDPSSYGNKIVGRLFIVSKEITDFLRSINGYGLKDERNPFHNIPDRYKWAFIKGLFDGDGCFSVKAFSISGRFELLQDVNEWIANELEREPLAVRKTSFGSKTYELKHGGSNAVRISRLMEVGSFGTYNSKKYTKFKNACDFVNMSIKELEYLAKKTVFRDEALLELDRRIPREETK